MSLVPLYSCWGVMIFVVSAFLWNLMGVWLFLVYISFTVALLISEVGMGKCSHNFGFLVFILIELLTFVSLFFVSHYSMPESTFEEVLYISEFDEFPMLGCIVLLSSSILVTGFHFNYGLSRCRWYLFFGIILGCCFMLVQFFEFGESPFYLTDCPYYVVAYSTIGLHFLHVLGGVTVLSIIFVLGYLSFNRFYVEMSVWYWHFVDYVWLLVFIVFYYPTDLWLPLF
uniref:Cytochrome c oxidase subunit 3 n=1 Tax=Diplostomum ardeae TaxID=1702217 RepID=A0A6M8NYK7_9TREM|nr:cytochrome c oxidase subunit III [Diplostomum ardeae]QKG04344.1 cytochrome c oxidase subunit III [Diplostomum ardeae]